MKSQHPNSKKPLVHVAFCLTILLSLCQTAPASAQTDNQDEKKFTGTDLITAAQQNDLALAKRILASGVDVNSANDYQATAILYACGTGNVELVKTLLELSLIHI